MLSAKTARGRWQSMSDNVKNEAYVCKRRIDQGTGMVINESIIHLKGDESPRELLKTAKTNLKGL